MRKRNGPCLGDRSQWIGTHLSISILLPVLAFSLSCEKAEQWPLVTVERYMSALQQRDNLTLALLWGPHRRQMAGADDEAAKALEEAFEQRVMEAHDGFDAAKESGVLPEDPLAVATFRALRLGKGAASIPLGVEIAEGGATALVRTRIVTNLDNLQLESLPLGVRVYLMAYPIGRLELMAVGYQKLEDKSLLGSVDIEWRLSRAPEGMDTVAGWLIESITPDPATAARWEPGKRG